MQFTDFILKFLSQLGYSKQAIIISTITDNSSDGYDNESPAVMVLGKHNENVIGVFVLADEADHRSTIAISATLQTYCKHFDRHVEKYIISHVPSAESVENNIEFYKCESSGQSSRIDISDFPSYAEMWLKSSLGSSRRKAARETRRSKLLVKYAYFFALVFLVLAVADIFVEATLDFSYLNTQRALLLVASVLLLFIPAFVKKTLHS